MAQNTWLSRAGDAVRPPKGYKPMKNTWFSRSWDAVSPPRGLLWVLSSSQCVPNGILEVVHHIFTVFVGAGPSWRCVDHMVFAVLGHREASQGLPFGSFWFPVCSWRDLDSFPTYLYGFRRVPGRAVLRLQAKPLRKKGFGSTFREQSYREYRAPRARVPACHSQGGRRSGFETPPGADILCN